MRGHAAIVVMLVDDHSMVRDAHRALLLQDFPEARFLERDSLAPVLADAPGAGAASGAGRPDLILLHFELAGGPQMRDLKALLRHYAGVPVVLTEAPERGRIALEALSHGVAGCLPKTMRGASILPAIHLVLSGERFIPACVLADHQGSLADMAPPAARLMPDMCAPIRALSPRRQQILSMVASGAPNKAIARALSVHEVTVKSHLRAIFKALGVNTRTQAARLAMFADMAALPGRSAETDYSGKLN
ncbi:transcriptional regulatory protein DegU [mine drainage metagenome]|uniref:Transcriptional regulatory protein DegU n=1 Tax=mine drainage metagenome TaxID=410659 RepID=A0A1J5RGW7_9ZZZZ